MRVDGVKQRVPFYTLDVIISVGYRVKSQRGIEFRQWANSVLKQYIINGYAINEKRLIALQKTVEIQSRMLADTLSVEQQDVLRTVSQYTEALLLLDQYDHHDLEKPESGQSFIFHLQLCDSHALRGSESFSTAPLK
ncbi:MAG: virulence RhuM family protein [Clostridiales bacterium]|nr:virulence RhuM family protein [Clostridiales bacterium]